MQCSIHTGFAFPAEIEIECIFTPDACTYTHSRKTRTREKKEGRREGEGRERIPHRILVCE